MQQGGVFFCTVTLRTYTVKRILTKCYDRQIDLNLMGAVKLPPQPLYLAPILPRFWGILRNEVYSVKICDTEHFRSAF